MRHNRDIFTIIVTMTFLNFFSRLTYENILSPMILARSANNSIALGIVNAAIGIGGIAGGIIAIFTAMRTAYIWIYYIIASRKI